MQFPIDYFRASNNMANCIIKLFHYWQNNIPSVTVHASDNFMINTATKAGVLRWGSMFLKTKVNSRNRKFRVVPIRWPRNYYSTVLSVQRKVFDFFKEYPDYHLLVDVSSDNHQCMLYILRDETNVRKFKCYAFYPRRH